MLTCLKDRDDRVEERRLGTGAINEYKYLLKFRAQSGDAQSSTLVCRKKWFLKNKPMEFVKIAYV